MSTESELSADVARFFNGTKEVRSGPADPSAAVTEVEVSFRRTVVRYAVHMLDTLDFHHMADDIAGGHLDPRYVPTLRSALAVLKATPWPDALDAVARSLTGSLSKLERDLIEKNEGEAKASGHDVHGQEHALAHEARDWLSAS